MEEAIDIVEAEEIYDGDIEKDFDFFAMSNIIDNDGENEGDNEPSFDEQELNTRQRFYETRDELQTQPTAYSQMATGRSLAQEI